MFSFLKDRKAQTAISSLVSSTPLSVSSASPPERGGALIVANALLLAGSETWGRHVLNSPRRLDSSVATEAVCVMVDEHARIEAAASSVDGRSSKDPAVSAFRWELMANEIVTLTFAAGLDKRADQAMRECWKSLWAARRSAEEALRLMQFYAKAYSIEPTPRIGGKRPGPDELRALATTLPPMFRKASRA